MRNLEMNPTKFLYHDDDGRVLKILKRMLKEYEDKDMGYQEILRGQIIELLILTMRKIRLPDTESVDNSMVRHIIKHVQKHYAEKLSLVELTQKYNYSLSYTSSIFKQETGYNFQEYVQTVRIKESCRLLLNTTKLVSEIAEAVGYVDTKFFNEIFKRQLGVTPRQYRKLNKASSILAQ
jgi:YesN/AraC family two-component response regulator